MYHAVEVKGKISYDSVAKFIHNQPYVSNPILMNPQIYRPSKRTLSLKSARLRSQLRATSPCWNSPENAANVAADFFNFILPSQVQHQRILEFHPKFRHWDELPSDILALIFQSFGLEDKLINLPRVCKSWSIALKGPHCWTEIDIFEWSKHKKQTTMTYRIDRLLRMLIGRSGDSLHKLSVYSLSADDMFSLIADNGNNLETMKLIYSSISNKTLENLARKLPSLKSLDVSHCKNINNFGLEAIGTNCRNLTSFCYNADKNTFRKTRCWDLAHAIATTMPKLKSLAIRNFEVGTECVIKIIRNCKEMEMLDITGCNNVVIDRKFLEGFPGLKVVRSPPQVARPPPRQVVGPPRRHLFSDLIFPAAVGLALASNYITCILFLLKR